MLFVNSVYFKYIKYMYSHVLGVDIEISIRRNLNGKKDYAD